MNLRRTGLACGILSPVLWLSFIGIAGAMRPEFSHITNYISELGEHGSSTEFMMRVAAFGFTGFLYPCFALALLATFRDGWQSMVAAGLIALDGMGRMGAGIFACDPGCGGVSMGQELHHTFATVGFLSGVLSAIAWGLVFRRLGWPPLIAWYSVASGTLALILLVLMTWPGNPVHAVGLIEHLATAVLSLWMLVFAVRLMFIPEQALKEELHERH